MNERFLTSHQKSLMKAIQLASFAARR
ncbi:unnamed protein product [Rhodiola kirilowii]